MIHTWEMLIDLYQPSIGRVYISKCRRLKVIEQACIDYGFGAKILVKRQEPRRSTSAFARMNNLIP